jgi:hypothetical protein
MALITVKQFQQREPALGSEPAIRFKIARGLFDAFVVRIGGRIYIDPEAWEAYKRNDGGRRAAA